MDKKTVQGVAKFFGISPPTAKKYLLMTEEEVNNLDAPANYKKRNSPMNAWLNVIFKMMLDGQSNETIYFYLLAQPEFHAGAKQAEKYVYLIGKNNFPNRPAFNATYLTEWVFPPDVLVISRTNLLKYLLTVNPKPKRIGRLRRILGLLKRDFRPQTE